MRLLAAFVIWLRARWLRIMALAGIAGALGVAGGAQLAEKERELVFRIEPGTASWYGGLPEGVEELDLPLAERRIVAGDDARRQSLHAWWWPADRKDAPAVLYLHGSRWNLTGQLFRIRQLHELGMSVLAVDYRGFGKSAGETSEKTVYEDARTAWDKLVLLQPDPQRRLIYGHSLGGAIAVDLAARLSEESKEAAKEAAPAARGLIVESSFTTLADVARAYSTKWLPVQLLLRQKFDSADKIARVRMPVLVAHGSADRFVPARLGQALYEAAPEPKRLLIVDGGTHNNSLRLGVAAYRKALRELFGLKM